MLGPLADEVSVGVRKDKDAVIPLNRPGLASSVARQARMTHRMHIAGPHALACLEAGYHVYAPARGHAFRDERGRLLNREGRRHLGLALGWDSALDLGSRYQTAPDQGFDEGHELPGVVTQ